MSLAEEVAALERDMAVALAENAALKARLAAVGVEPLDSPEWADGLAPGPLALMSMLIEAGGRTVSIWRLEEGMPKRDHVEERDIAIVKTTVGKLRARFGRACIENDRGRGYRCGAAFLLNAKA